METWSDSPVSDEFTVNISLDTNILSYLIDKSYRGLSLAIDHMRKSSFVSFISSRYTIFEFVGIRKKEHFLQKVLDADMPTGGGRVNLSSLLKYRNEFDSEKIKYHEVQTFVKREVERELRKIEKTFKIDIESNGLHDNLWKPTFDLCLASRISREDSLVTVSAIFPNEFKKEKHLTLLTNDKNFFKWHENEKESAPAISSAYSSNGLTKPEILHLSKIESDGRSVNLTKDEDIHKVKKIIFSKLRNLIIAKNESRFLGKTIPCEANPERYPNLICFKMEGGKVLKQNLYLSIIGKDLDFIHTTRFAVNDFWNNRPIPNYPHAPATEEEMKISFEISDRDDTGRIIALDPSIVGRLREKGNLVFVHPDT